MKSMLDNNLRGENQETGVSDFRAYGLPSKERERKQAKHDVKLDSGTLYRFDIFSSVLTRRHSLPRHVYGTAHQRRPERFSNENQGVMNPGVR